MPQPAVRFAILHQPANAKPYAVIYARHPNPADWSIYQSDVCNRDTAITIARALEAAGVDPEND